MIFKARIKPARRILGLLLSLALVCGLMPAALAAAGMSNFQTVNSDFAGKFTDVDASAWYAGDVQAAYELGLVQGSSASTFSPDGNITVGSAIALACRLHSIYHTGAADFVQGDPWYQVYVDYAADNGIIADGQFSDYNASATRRQFAAILAKALPADELAAINTIADGDIPDLAADSANYDDIYLLYRAGVLTGSDKYGTFNPETTIGRSSVAAIVARMALPVQRRTVTLVKAPTGITLDQTALSLNPGGTAKLTASITPEDAGDKTVTWTSSNTKVATVADGTVTAVANGTATITAATANGLKAACTVTVAPRQLSTAPLYSDANVTITFVSVERSRYDAGEAILSLDVQNKTGRTLTVQADAVSLNGYTFNDLVMSDDVSANSTGTVETTIQNFDSSLVSLSSVETVGGQFRIILGGVGAGSETTYAQFDATNLYTGEIDNTIPTVSGTALYSDENVEFYFDRAEPDRYSSDEINVYLTVRNKSDRTALIQNDTVVISGRSYDRTVMSHPVLPHSTGEVRVSVREYTGPAAASITTIGGDFRVIDDLGDGGTYVATMGGNPSGGWDDSGYQPGGDDYDDDDDDNDSPSGETGGKFTYSDAKALDNYAGDALSACQQASKTANQYRSSISRSLMLQQAVSYGLSAARSLDSALDILNNRTESELTDGTTLRQRFQDTYDLLIGLEHITITDENADEAYKQIIDILLNAQADCIILKNLTGKMLDAF